MRGLDWLNSWSFLFFGFECSENLLSEFPVEIVDKLIEKHRGIVDL